MKCRIIPLFAAVASVPMLFGATPLNAQEAQRWTLEECIAYAFEHNIEVKQAELDVQTKRLTRSDAGWAYAPDISASSSYSFSSGRVLDPTTYEFVEHQSVNGTSTSVGASVTLFNGMRNLHNLERSRLDLRAALLGVEKARNDIRLNITAYYLEILCAEENIRNAEQTVETLKYRRKRPVNRSRWGKSPLPTSCRYVRNWPMRKHSFVGSKFLRHRPPEYLSAPGNRRLHDIPYRRSFG